jgi:putative heme iron utilization protein
MTDADLLSLAKALLRGVRSGALATIDAVGGGPFASLVNTATDLNGSPLLLLSGLAAHTRNLEHEPRASLLLARSGRGDPLAHPRLTVSGTLSRSPAPHHRERFLARHPKAGLYAGFADFAVWRMEIAVGHLNGGFARAAMLDPDDLLVKADDAAPLLAAEADALAHLNTDHGEALSLYATALAGERPGRWQASGIDPEGLDLMAGERTARIPFPRRVVGPGDLRQVLKDLAAAARLRVNQTS